jgi:hypothetical protein
MKINELIKKLQAIAKEHGNLDVVRCTDGNDGFSTYNISPSVGDYTEGDFIVDDSTEEFADEYKVNAVCIN